LKKSRLFYAIFLYCYASLMYLPFASSKVYAETVELKGLAKQSYMARYMYKEYVKPHPERPNFSAPVNWLHECFSVEGVPMEKIAPMKPKGKKVVLQLHGGAYIYGITDWYRQLAVKESEMAGRVPVYLVEYRLAPEYRHPAALEDAFTAYSYLLEEGYAPKDIIVLGDSAGANLALALALYLRDKGLEQPKCLLLLSPWTSMDNDLPYRALNYDKDLVLGSIGSDAKNMLSKLTYGKGMEKDPYVSPRYADLTGLPPLLIQAGGYEMLLDDALLLAEAAKKYGVKHKLTVYPEMSHDFQVFLPQMQESVQAFAEMAAFIKDLK